MGVDTISGTTRLTAAVRCNVKPTTPFEKVLIKIEERNHQFPNSFSGI